MNNFKIDSLFNSKTVTLIAGPCAVESKSQLEETAKILSGDGVKILRGGTFKPRTFSSSFQGLGEEGLKLLSEAGKNHNLLVVTEVMDALQLNLATSYVDILQVGARSMQNFPLLTAIGKTQIPVILKRGFCATIDEWLAASEYIMREGNKNIILCERGIRTFENSTRFTLDISSIPIVKNRCNLPIIVDPSHAAGNSTLIEPLAKASIAAGCDGIMVEVHPDPATALSDGPQSLKLSEFSSFRDSISTISESLGKTLQ